MKICACRIVPARRFDQTEIAFVNQVEQRHAEMAEALRIANDHSQVRLHEPTQRDLIAMLLHSTAKLPLGVVRE